MERAELRKWLLASTPARARGEFVFLQDPSATEEESGKLEQIWESGVSASREKAGDAFLDAGRGWICVPTGGSSGRTKWARHDEASISGAVSGFCLHYGLQRVNAVSVLPLYHISGLMAQLRCLATGGTYVQWDWRNLAAGDWPALTTSDEGWAISLVPTQLQRLLTIAGGVEFLLRFRFIFIGGAAAWPRLLDAATEKRLALNLSYGMTETAAMVAAQREGAFALGERDSGTILPHARVRIVREDGQTSSAGEIGQVRIAGANLFRGYFPDTRTEAEFAPEDLGRLDAAGRLTILGRRDGMIITGGEKVWPAEVESALRETGLFSDVAVLGLSDQRWGEVVTVFYPAPDGSVDLERVHVLLEGKMSPYKWPKRIIPIDPWPRNDRGKVNRVALTQFAQNEDADD